MKIPLNRDKQFVYCTIQNNSALVRVETPVQNQQAGIVKEVLEVGRQRRVA